MVPRTYISGVGMCCGLTSELNPLFCHWAACANDCHHRGLHDVQSGRVVILVIKVTVGLARVRRSAQESVELASFELGFAGIGFPRNASGFDGSTGFVGFAGIGSQRRASGFDKSTGFVGFVASGSSAEPRFLMGALHMWIFAGFAALPRM